jgi:hypothetical protein
MPLHVGNGLDRGGNNCKVFFHKKETNLHQLWDEKLIEFTRLSFTEMTKFVSAVDTKTLNTYKSGTIIDWARESKQIRMTLYPEVEKPKEVVISDAKVKWYCQRGLSLENEKYPQLGYEYSYKFMPVLEKRLFQGGIRLALILNQIF